MHFCLISNAYLISENPCFISQLFNKAGVSKWAGIFKAETLEELEQLARGEEVFENMVVTMKKLSEDEKIRMQCEAREDYERCLLTEYNAGKREGIELERENTEKERQRADDAVQRANDAVKRAAELEAEVKRLQELLQ